MKQPPLTTIFILLCFIYPLLLQAQNQLSKVSEPNEQFVHVANSFSNPEEHFNCATDEHHEFLMRTNATYRNNFQAYAQKLDSVLNTNTNDRNMPPQYTIPVVVHVIHLGEPVGTGSNLSDAQIQDAIDGLNQHYHNANGQGTDIEIDFCLATRTPEGCQTNGILRVDGSGVPNYATDGIEYSGPGGASEASIKALSHWPHLEYYNIWVVNDIYGDWAGYAYFPGTSDELDGAVIGKDFMTGDGKTLSHELGHAFNLKHTWQGDGTGNTCPNNTNCMTMGDAICDTPPHRRGDCGNTNPCSNEGNWDNTRYNWMNYCVDPPDLGRFTPDQRTRMRATMLVSPRADLLNSMGCVHIALPEFVNDDDPLCAGESKEIVATPTGGVLSVVSGPGELQGNLLLATGEGTIMLKYARCNDDAFQTVEAHQIPAPVFTSSDDPMCSSTARIISCEPTGGDFTLISGPGSLVENELTADASGSILIGYTININGCTGDTIQEITIQPTPEPEITSSDLPICDGQTRMLSAIPGGGDFTILSGPAILNGDTLMPNENGTVILEYYVGINGCNASDTQSIQVSSLPVPGITSSAERMCSSEERLLTAIPLGGQFSVLSGPGVIIGDTLSTNGLGEIHIQYILAQNGCSATAEQFINSQQGVDGGFINPPDHMCVNDSIVLNAFPAGGIYQLLSGPGELNTNMLKATGAGNIRIEYTILQDGCAGSEQKTITSAEIPQPFFTMDTSFLCSGQSRVATATPGGGVFWIVGGPGIVENDTLTSAGPGLIKLAYLVNNEGCAGEDLQLFTSRLTPQVEFATDTLYICVGEEKPVDIIPASSQLNLLSGPGTLSGHVLTSTGMGPLELTGQYEANGCVGTDTLFISSNPVPTPEINIDTIICIGNSVQLTANPPGGAFAITAGAGILNGNIVTTYDIGPVQIRYTVEENHCTGHIEGQIMVIDPIAEVVASDHLLSSVSPIGIFQWLDCEHNFEPLPGETGRTLVVTVPGSYALVNGAGACIDTSACVTAILTNTLLTDADQPVRVFPNPVSSKLRIAIQGQENINEICLFDSLGKRLKIGEELISGNYLDLEAQHNGIYFLVIQTDDGRHYVYRVVKI